MFIRITILVSAGLAVFSSLVELSSAQTGSQKAETVPAKELLLSDNFLTAIALTAPDTKAEIRNLLLTEPLPADWVNRVLVDNSTTHTRARFERALFGLDPGFEKRSDFLKQVSMSSLYDAPDLANQHAHVLNWALEMIDKGADCPVGLDRLVAQSVLNENFTADTNLALSIEIFFRYEALNWSEKDSVEEAELLARIEKHLVGSELHRLNEGTLRTAVAVLSHDSATNLMESIIADAGKIEPVSDNGESTLSLHLELAKQLAKSHSVAFNEALIESIDTLQKAAFDVENDRHLSEALSELDLKLPQELDDYLSDFQGNKPSHSGAIQLVRQLNFCQSREVVRRLTKVSHEINDDQDFFRAAGLASRIKFFHLKREFACELISIAQATEDEHLKSVVYSSASLFFSDLVDIQQRQILLERFVANVANASQKTRNNIAIQQREMSEFMSTEELARVIDLLWSAKPIEPERSGNSERSGNMVQRTEIVRLVNLYEQKTLGISIPRFQQSILGSYFHLINEPRYHLERKSELNPRLAKLLAEQVASGDADSLTQILECRLIPQHRESDFVSALFANLGEMRRDILVSELIDKVKSETEKMEGGPGMPRIVRSSNKPDTLRAMLLGASELSSEQCVFAVTTYYDIAQSIGMGDSRDTILVNNVIRHADRMASVECWKFAIDCEADWNRSVSSSLLQEISSCMNVDAITDCLLATHEIKNASVKDVPIRYLQLRIADVSLDELENLLARAQELHDTNHSEASSETLSAIESQISRLEADIAEPYLLQLRIIVRDPATVNFDKLKTIVPNASMLKRLEKEDQLEAVRLLLAAAKKAPAKATRTLQTSLITLQASLGDELIPEQLLSIWDVMHRTTYGRQHDPEDIERFVNQLPDRARKQLLHSLLSRFEDVTDEVDFQEALKLMHQTFPLVRSTKERKEFDRVVSKSTARALVQTPALCNELLKRRRVQVFLDSNAWQYIVDHLKSPYNAGNHENSIVTAAAGVNFVTVKSVPEFVEWLRTVHPEVDFDAKPENMESLLSETRAAARQD